MAFVGHLFVLNPADPPADDTVIPPSQRVLLEDGKILAFAGTLSGNTYKTWIYNPVLNSWHSSGDFPTNQFPHAAVRLTDGRVLATGSSISSKFVSSLFDPVSDTWSVSGQLMGNTDSEDGLTFLFSNHALVRLDNGLVLAVCTYLSGASYSLQSQLYDPETESWMSITTLTVTTSRIQAFNLFKLPSGNAVILFSIDAPSSGCLTALYDPSDNSWVLTSQNTDTDFQNSFAFASALLPSGKILILSPDAGSTAVWIYDPTDDSWTAASSVSEAVVVPALVSTPTGVIRAGGKVPNTIGSAAAAYSAEKYVEITDTWEALPARNAATVPVYQPAPAQQSAVLVDDSVYVIGGADPLTGDTSTNIVERYYLGAAE